MSFLIVVIIVLLCEGLVVSLTAYKHGYEHGQSETRKLYNFILSFLNPKERELLKVRMEKFKQEHSKETQ